MRGNPPFRNKLFQDVCETCFQLELGNVGIEQRQSLKFTHEKKTNPIVVGILINDDHEVLHSRLRGNGHLVANVHMNEFKRASCSNGGLAMLFPFHTT